MLDSQAARRLAPLALALFSPLLAGVAFAQTAARSDPAEDPQVAIALALGRIADSLERLERAQGQEVWLRRTEISAIRQRELDRQLAEIRDRISGLSGERQTLLGNVERLANLARDPNYPQEEIESQRLMLQDRMQVVVSALTEARDRRSELEARLAEAERELEGRLLDLDRQLRAP